jgi:hypothetical protein
MNSSEVQTMDSRTFQEKLRGHHIVVTDVNLSQIPCNRRGFLTLNGLKEIVDMEGMIITFLVQASTKPHSRPEQFRNTNDRKTYRQRVYRKFNQSKQEYSLYV